MLLFSFVNLSILFCFVNVLCSFYSVSLMFCVVTVLFYYCSDYTVEIGEYKNELFYNYLRSLSKNTKFSQHFIQTHLKTTSEMPNNNNRKIY